MKQVKIGNKYIGENNRTYIVAEIGVNHNGNMNMLKLMIDKAVEAGVDAVKFQKFKTEELVTRDAPKAEYQKKVTDNNESQFDMLKRLELSEVQIIELKKYAESKQIEAFATPFDEESVEFLDKIGVNAYKIGSGDITNLPMLEKISLKKKPIILSTGMSTLGEIEDAINVIRKNNRKIILMHCTSNYPANYEDVNLNAMDTLKTAFQLPTGYSDHTMGNEVSLAAVARGAVIIEKHFTLDRNLPGPDHRASLEPEELKKLVTSIRNVETALGSYIKEPSEKELEVKAVAQKSIVANRKIEKGEIISKDMLAIKRPGTGIIPKYMKLIIGMKVVEDINEDEIVDFKKLSN